MAIKNGYYFVRGAYKTSAFLTYNANTFLNGSSGSNTISYPWTTARQTNNNYQIWYIEENTTKGWYNIKVKILNSSAVGYLGPEITQGAPLGKRSELEMNWGEPIADNRNYSGWGWDIFERGTMSVDGVTCNIVSLVSKTELISGAPTLDFTDSTPKMQNYNVSSANQKLVLIPAILFNSSLPTPYGLNHGNSSNSQPRERWVGSDSSSDVQNVKMQWTTTTAFNNTHQTKGYQLWWTKYQRVGNSNTWTQTDTSGAWYFPTYSTNGPIIWGPKLNNQPTGSYTNTKLWFKVRACTLDSSGNVESVGAEAQQYTIYHNKPELTLTSVGWCPSGLRIQGASSFTQGATYLKGLRVGQHRPWRNDYGGICDQGDRNFTIAGGSFSLILPWEKISDLCEFETTNPIRLKCTLSTSDNWSSLAFDKSITPTAIVGKSQTDSTGTSYAYVNTTTPAVDIGERGLAEVVWPASASSTLAWQMRKIVVNSNWTHSKVFPMFAGSATNKSLGMFSDSGTNYFCMVYKDTASKKWSMLRYSKPLSLTAHCFYWLDDDGTIHGVIIWVNKDDPIVEERSFSTSSTKLALNGRDHSVVHYLQGETGNYIDITQTVNGYIVPAIEKYGTTVDDVEDMVEVGYVFYRSPSGRVANVAITDASVTMEKNYSEVSISFVELSETNANDAEALWED